MVINSTPILENSPTKETQSQADVHYIDDKICKFEVSGVNGVKFEVCIMSIDSNDEELLQYLQKLLNECSPPQKPTGSSKAKTAMLSLKSQQVSATAANKDFE